MEVMNLNEDNKYFKIKKSDKKCILLVAAVFLNAV